MDQRIEVSPQVDAKKKEVEMDVTFTNFDGDTNEPCAFCGKPQHTHFVDLGRIDGQRYAHHLPCDAQMKTLGVDIAPRKKRVARFLEQLFPSKAA